VDQMIESIAMAIQQKNLRNICWSLMSLRVLAAVIKWSITYLGTVLPW